MHCRSQGFFQALIYLLVVAGSIAPCAAQQVPTEPASTHIFPAGGRRGTVVPVRVGGEFFAPYTRFRMFGDGVHAPTELVVVAKTTYEPSPRRKPGGTPMNYPREWESEVTIDADAPLGQVLWRCSSARAGTGGRPFVIGELPEHIEAESNSVPEKAESIALPVTVNGQIAGERDLDYFQFDVNAGDVVSIDLAAARIGSPLDPVVEVRDSAGRPVLSNQIRIGTDPVVSFRAANSGTYRVLVSNLNFRGGPQYVYRMTMTTEPYIAYAFPPGGQIGTSGSIEFFTLSGNNDLSSEIRIVDFPANTANDFPLTDSKHSANLYRLQLTDLPTVIEKEPNNDLANATTLPWPGVAYGRFSVGSDSDWYSLHAGKDQKLCFECRTFPAGSGSLPLISVCDPQGHELAKASLVELLPKSCRLEWSAPADDRYLVCVRDVRQGGQVTPYELVITASRPDFSLTATTDVANVVQGARGELELKIDRQGGFVEPIDIAIEGLPAGVRFEPNQIPNGPDIVKIALIAEDECRPGDSRLTIRGSAKLGEQIVTRMANAAHLGRDVEGVSLGDSTVDHVALTVRHKQVFRLFCSEAYQYACRGTIYPYKMQVERMNGFQGPILLELGDRQIMDLDGVEIVDSVFPADVTELMLPLYLPETMHINIQPHSNIYAQGYVVFQDKWGQKQSMLQVSEMRCMIRPLPTVAKLSARSKSASVRAGETQTCALHLERSSNFAGSMQVELVDAANGIHATSAVIPAGESDTVVTITADHGYTDSRQRPLKFRGIGELPGGAKVVSEAILSP